jgi:hypothetical protein
LVLRGTINAAHAEGCAKLASHTSWLRGCFLTERRVMRAGFKPCVAIHGRIALPLL